MRLPVSWLRDFVRTDASAEQIAAALTARGLAVDAVLPQPTPSHIVIGEVESLERHPNADRLRVGIVSVGAQKLKIVTGADNVVAGNKVPIALVGATVFEHGDDGGDRVKTKTIAKTTLRGVESNGMMCSATELALPGEFPDGILIMEDEAAVGEDFWRVARFGDAVLDIDVPSNRPDCLSVVGLAREAAAALGATFDEPHLDAYAGTTASPINVEAEPAVCRRFVGQYFWNIAPRRTPMWMRLRLHAAGVRSINYWIDVSNYAQLETGQPMHFYDAKKVRGKTLAAREARAGETVRTLDGVERKLPRGIPVIADVKGPVGIAGVYGGADTAVSDATSELFLESASFVGPRIRRAAKELGLRTEAGARHEKNLPLQLGEFGRRHAARLLVAAGATPSQVVAAGGQSVPPREVTVRPARVNKVLGTDYSIAEIRKALEALAFAPGGTDALRVTVPYWRDDVVEEIDLVEEVARAIGYDRIAERPAVAAPQSVDEGLFRQESSLANRAASLGYREVVTLGLQGSRVVAAWERSGIPFWSDASSVANPLSEDQRLLRPSLLPGLLAVAARAWPRVKEDVKFFELGHIFRTLEGKDVEWPSLGGLAVFADSREDTAIDARLRAVMGDAEALIAKLCGPTDIRMKPKARAYFHPGASANMSLAGETVGKVGRLHPRLARAYELPAQTYAFFLYLEKLSLEPAVRRFTPLPRFPGTQRDIAVVVNEDVAARDLVDAVNATRAPVVEKVTPFDEYRGPQVDAGKKSVALRIALRKLDATITDAEADAAVESIVAALAEKFGASLRGPAA